LSIFKICITLFALSSTRSDFNGEQRKNQHLGSTTLIKL
jgi:hypothetical protein